MKDKIKLMAQKNVEFMKAIGKIRSDTTGQVVLEMNINKGNLCDVIIATKERCT